jgi:hypothetical protein
VRGRAALYHADSWSGIAEANAITLLKIDEPVLSLISLICAPSKVARQTYEQDGLDEGKM